MRQTNHGPNVLTPSYYSRLFGLEEAHGWARGMRSYSAALLGPMVSGNGRLRALDQGCGTGRTMSWLEAFGNASVVGIDLSRVALDFCRERGHLELAEGSAMALPFQDGAFDLVVCTDVLQHLPNPPGDSAALVEALRVLRPGGYLYLRTNSGCGEQSDASQRDDRYRRYKRGDLAQRVERAGFVIERATYANALPSLPTLARRRLRAQGRSTNGQQYHAELRPDPGLGLRIRPPSRRWLDAVLALLLGTEAWVVGRVGADLPFGDSLLVLARKPSAPVIPPLA